MAVRLSNSRYEKTNSQLKEGIRRVVMEKAGVSLPSSYSLQQMVYAASQAGVNLFVFGTKEPTDGS